MLCVLVTGNYWLPLAEWQGMRERTLKYPFQLPDLGLPTEVDPAKATAHALRWYPEVDPPQDRDPSGSQRDLGMGEGALG